MGRSRSPEHFTSDVKRRRQGAGLTQRELASRVGVTRQALAGIEAGDFLPNTAISLRLAAELGCRVEELFRLGELASSEEIVEPRPDHPGRGRLSLARVDRRLVGYPTTGDQVLADGFGPADALATDEGPPELLVAPEVLERTLLVLGCDPALALLEAHLPRVDPRCRVLVVPASSTDALKALERGHAHVAGTHLVTGSGRPDLRPARKVLRPCGGDVVTFAVWDQGLVLAPGNPKRIRRLEDLCRRDVRLVNRAPGAGSRLVLDTALARAGIDPSELTGYDRELASHADVCRAVSLGVADAGIAVASLAQVAGLDFLPLGDVRFDLAIPASARSHPAVRALRELLTDARFLRELGALPGYAVSTTGEQVAEVESSA